MVVQADKDNEWPPWPWPPWDGDDDGGDGDKNKKNKTKSTTHELAKGVVKFETKIAKASLDL
jgi:endothelin-converting enzyme